MFTRAMCVMAVCLVSTPVWATLVPTDLRVEYKKNPLGIDVTVPRFTWFLSAEEPGQYQTAYQILVATSRDLLQQDQWDLWDSKKTESDSTALIPYSGLPLRSRMTCYWKVRVWDKDGNPSPWSEIAMWSMGLLTPEDWQAKWIGYDEPDTVNRPEYEKIVGKYRDQTLDLPPPPYLRREFTARKNIKRATAYASAFGLYEMYLNGRRVGDYYFTPGWTDYRKRVYYNTYDVTDYLRAGQANAIGAILADGWYAGYLSYLLLSNHPKARGYYGDKPRFLVQIEIEYEDGKKDVIVSDGSWRASYGPIRQADLLHGEARDNRISLGAWTEHGYDDSAWKPVAVTEKVDVLIQAHPATPVMKHEKLPAKSFKQLSPGVFMYDLGQNMVGWVQLTVNGKEGDLVRVRQTEMVNPDGSVYTEHLRSARATDFYFLAGKPDEVLEPAFTFHGFRHVEVTGLDTPPAPEQVVGVVLHSPLEWTGEFECSNPLVNQLYQNIRWGQKGNYFEVPTDCPQRDERLGWTGDAQVFMPTAAFNADVGAFFTKWLVDLVQDSQLPDGSFAHVAPNVEQEGGAVGWGDAAILCTYYMFQFYGDQRIVEKNYPNLVRHMEFLERTSKDYMRDKVGFGDWVNLGGGASDLVIGTAYFAYLARLMAEMGERLGDIERAKHYTELYQNIRRAFAENLITEEGKIRDSSQTGYVLAFSMDLVPEDKKQRVVEHFAEEIHKFKGHLATGFLGTARLLPSLVLAGRPDLAYRLLLNDDYPSWLYQVKLGATTMWERWDGWTPEKGFQDPGMNSFNHYAFGAVGEFLYRHVLGIQEEEPSFKKVRIAPIPGGSLTYAKGAYRSIRGRIASSWKIEGDQITLTVTIPPNVTARVFVPTTDPQSVKTDNEAFISPESEANKAVVYRVQPGTWTFRATWKP